MNIVVLGAGVQGTVLGVRLAAVGHEVTLIARGSRAAELRQSGAAIDNARNGRRETANVRVTDELTPQTIAELCFVTVRREQIQDALAVCAAGRRIGSFVFMVNHANGSTELYNAIGRGRVIIGFPGMAGGIENGVVQYVEVAEQPTAIESAAPDVAALLKSAEFRVALVRDMDSWLKRHVVFVTAICGAIYEAGGDAQRLSADPHLLRSFVLAVREGWAALDRIGVGPPPLALSIILRRVPIAFAISYWRRLTASPRGELYFARHARHAPKEMAALAADVRDLAADAEMPNLRSLYAAIDRAAR